MSWFLYLIECADDSVYTGITTDVAARFDEHASGKGARYTRSRKPRAVLASFPLPDRSSASRAEYWVKRLTPAQKRELAAGLRTLESVLPVVATLDESADAPGLPVRTRGRKKAKTDTIDDAAKAAETEPIAGKTGKTAKAATTAKTAKTPGSARKPKAAKAAPVAKRVKTDGDAVGKKTASRDTPVKKARPAAPRSSKKKAPAAANKPVANGHDDAASTPARRRSSGTQAAEAAAVSVTARRSKRAESTPTASTSARKKPARTRQNRAAS
ncbi:MAG: GIY-YIG nuclease family protein [Burkholderia sp.]|jgi:putative endonuclease|uniref:GIY-YIG nuclease family protein n=1 Tax=Burkholderia sp. TaxID=36773 RepID=UPI0028258EC1|nr:GIY-YIG nuclease family protein [Burkholderia sp.]MDR0244416.1 GIY-YIG nuclease family protein [Burkholderia sp.]